MRDSCPLHPLGHRGGDRSCDTTFSHQPGAERVRTASFAETNVNIPAPTDTGIRGIISRSARELGLTTRAMPSGAGHDAQDMTRLGPVGMIFVPSVAGISHAPKEFTSPTDIENGANVLLRTVLALDSRWE